MIRRCAFEWFLWLVLLITSVLSFGNPGNNVCPKTFAMEEDWGRARVMKQRVDSDPKLQEAIDTCPVSCIHWSVTVRSSLSSYLSSHLSLHLHAFLHQGVSSPAEFARGFHGENGARRSLEHDGGVHGRKQGCICGASVFTEWVLSVTLAPRK